MAYVYGLILGIVWMVVQMLSVKRSILSVDSSLKITFSLWFSQFLLPFVISFVVLILISKNDIEYKISIFPMFLFGFYSICLPYWGYTYPLDSSYFILLVKPCLIALLLITIVNCFSVISRMEFLSGSFILSVITCLLTSLIPFLSESFWYTGFNLIVIIATFAGLLVISFFSALLKRI